MARDLERHRESNGAWHRASKWKRTLTPPDARRTIPVRLTDVPLDIRLDAARAVCRVEPPNERQHILAAALAPSDDVHWIAA